ncbi:retrovirus-related pol polyprotein from transposon TNT 1-94 [Tanacetum coccineum]
MKKANASVLKSHVIDDLAHVVNSNKASKNVPNDTKSANANTPSREHKESVSYDNISNPTLPNINSRLLESSVPTNSNFDLGIHIALVQEDGPFQPKTAEGVIKPKSQWTQDERRVVVQDQRLKSIIMSCLPDDIMESAISCETAKATWTDLVHSFEGPLYTKEYRIMDLKLEYQTFMAKPSENHSHTYTRYKTLINELANDGVTLSKHAINVGFVNSLPENWLSFSQGLKNANHTQTPNLADIYRSQGEPKVQKDYKAKYKKMKAKLELLEASPPTSQTLKPFQSKNKGLVAEMFDWDKEEVFDDEEETRLNHALRDQLKEERKVNEKWLNSLNKASQCISEQIPKQKKKILGGEQLITSSSKNNAKDNPFVVASLDYDHEMVLKSKDWVERLNSDSKLPNFNTGKILALESSEPQTPLPPLKNLQGASSSSEVMTLTYQDHSPRERSGLGTMKHIKPETQESSNKNVSEPVTVSNPKPVTSSVPTEVKTNYQVSKINKLIKLVQMLMDEKITSTQKSQEPIYVSSKPESSKILYCMRCKKEDHRTSDHDMYTASQKRSENYMAQPYQHASPSKQILKAKAKPFPPCIHCGFNDHTPNDYRNYTECKICGKQLGLKVVFGDNSSCITEGDGSINYGGIVFSKVAFVNGLKYNLISINQLRDAKYIIQFDDKQGKIFNANKEIILIAPRRNDVYVLDMTSLTPNGACFFAKASESDKPCSACEKGKHKRASFKTKQNFSIRKCLHLLHMDLFGPVNLMSINHEKNTLVIVDEYSSRNKNRTLIEAARKMLNGSVLFKHFWTEAVRIAYYSHNRSIIIKRYDRTPYKTFKERIPDISYFYIFGCPVFIHNYKDYLGKFDAKADDGYFLRYSFNSKAFRVFNTRRQQIDETYHVTFDESIEAIRFTNISVDEIQIDDSSRYPPDEYVQEDDPSKQYQTNSNISYYIIPYGRSLTELTKENHVPKVIAPNEPDIPHTKDLEGPPDLINTEGTHEQNVQDEQTITQSTKGPSRNNTDVSVSIIKSLIPDVPQSQISNQASISSHPVPQNRWSKDQHIELVNIIELVNVYLLMLSLR